MTQNSTKKASLDFKRINYETKTQLYKRGQQFVGAVQRQQRRYIALAELEMQLRDSKHVQNRTLQTHLTQDQYTAMQAAWTQQQLIRSGSKHKPDAIKLYEAGLNSAQLQNVKAKELHKQGHADGASAMQDLCKTQMQSLLTQIQAAITNDPTLSQWLDRQIPAANSSLTVDQMPRSITSNSKSCLIVRKSKADIKLEAVQAAMRELQQDKD